MTQRRPHRAGRPAARRIDAHGEHHKPLFILNYKGFYNHLKELAQMMKDEQFIPEEESYKPQYVDSLEQLIQELQLLKTK